MIARPWWSGTWTWAAASHGRGTHRGVDRGAGLLVRRESTGGVPGRGRARVGPWAGGVCCGVAAGGGRGGSAWSGGPGGRSAASVGSRGCRCHPTRRRGGRPSGSASCVLEAQPPAARVVPHPPAGMRARVVGDRLLVGSGGRPGVNTNCAPVPDASMTTVRSRPPPRDRGPAGSRTGAASCARPGRTAGRTPPGTAAAWSWPPPRGSPGRSCGGPGGPGRSSRSRPPRGRPPGRRGRRPHRPPGRRSRPSSSRTAGRRPGVPPTAAPHRRR